MYTGYQALKIAILNLMPNKLDTELHLLRSLSKLHHYKLDITFLQTESYVPTHVIRVTHGEIL